MYYDNMKKQKYLINLGQDYPTMGSSRTMVRQTYLSQGHT